MSGRGGSGRGVGLGAQGRCVGGGVRVGSGGLVGLRMDVNEEKKMGVGWVRGVGLGGGQGRCERRSEVFVNIQKKIVGGGGSGQGGGSGLGGQGGCERRMEVFVNIQKKMGVSGRGGGGRVGGSGWGHRVDVNGEVKFL